MFKFNSLMFSVLLTIAALTNSAIAAEKTWDAESCKSAKEKSDQYHANVKRFEEQRTVEMKNKIVRSVNNLITSPLIDFNSKELEWGRNPNAQGANIIRGMALAAVHTVLRDHDLLARSNLTSIEFIECPEGTMVDVSFAKNSKGRVVKRVLECKKTLEDGSVESVLGTVRLDVFVNYFDGLVLFSLVDDNYYDAKLNLGAAELALLMLETKPLSDENLEKIMGRINVSLNSVLAPTVQEQWQKHSAYKNCKQFEDASATDAGSL